MFSHEVSNIRILYFMFEGPGFLAASDNVEQAGVHQTTVQAKLVKRRLDIPKKILLKTNLSTNYYIKKLSKYVCAMCNRYIIHIHM